jgi:hypothetical protein
MANYISNAFSLNMIDWPADLRVEPVSVEEVKSLLKAGFVSCVGHEATATIFSQVLGIQIPANRISIKLQNDDCLIVGQIMCRLPEGKILSEEEVKAIPISWVRVYIWRGWARDEGDRWAVWADGVPPTVKGGASRDWHRDEFQEGVGRELGARFAYCGDDPWSGVVYFKKKVDHEE